MVGKSFMKEIRSDHYAQRSLVQAKISSLRLNGGPRAVGALHLLTYLHSNGVHPM